MCKTHKNSRGVGFLLTLRLLSCNRYILLKQKHFIFHLPR